MKTYCNNPPPKPGMTEENVARFENNLAQADALRANLLSGLHELRTAKLKSTERELNHTAARLGEDHPSVVRLKAEVAAGQRVNRQLGAEVDRSKITPPVVDERGWTLHGFVRNQDLQGQGDLTVALFDRTNRWVEALGHICTDSRGYFQLCYDPGADKLQELFIRVLNQKRQVLYRDKKPMRAVLGEVKYREIILNGESDRCQPPSDPSSKEPFGSAKSLAKAKSRKTQAPKKAPRAKKN
jgi:hypothetical protein